MRPWAAPASTTQSSRWTWRTLRANGVRSLLIWCRNCHHEKIMNVDHLPGNVTVPSLGQRMSCVATVDTSPNSLVIPTSGNCAAAVAAGLSGRLFIRNIGHGANDGIIVYTLRTGKEQ
jgi:hypothetical protein